ncbi:MAG: radical SAM protein [Deltaproteobacteria bacterium]|nr:radical SAM protein [Deltaproteobacteria bacterium]
MSAGFHHPHESLARVPDTCFWEITDACNLRCIHCEQSAGTRRPDELDGEEALRLADQLADAGCRCVNLTGGEPLVRPDWPRLARRLADRGVLVAVVTNGVLVDDDAVRRMLDSGVAAVAVSLDGERDVHDAIRVPASRTLGSVFDRAVAALDRLAATRLKLAVITQVHRRNLERLEAMHELLAAHRIDAWQIQVAMPLGRLLEYREQYLIRPGDLPRLEAVVAGFVREGRIPIRPADNIGYYGCEEAVLRRTPKGEPAFWTGCTAGLRVAAVCSNGDVKGCPSHPRAFVVGNVRERTFGEIWAREEGFAYNTRWNDEDLVGGCARCPFRHICRGGCRTMAFSVTGTIHDNPFCLQRAGS